VPPASPSLPGRLVRLAALAGALSLALDLAASRLPALAPPYLLLDYVDEAFRVFLSPAVVAIAASCANGAMAALLALGLEPVARRRALKLAAALAGLWIGSGALFLLVYVRAPWTVALGSLASSLPRAALVGWALDRALRRTDGSRAGPLRPA